MASDQHTATIENSIGYSFHTKELLRDALISAGVVAEDHDGNRKLANLGTSLVALLVAYLGYEAATSRSYANDVRIGINNKTHCAAVIERIGIDEFIQYNPRQRGVKMASVTSKAFNAIVGAVFKDSGDDLVRVLKMLLHVGAFTREYASVDPTVLSLDALADVSNIPDMATALLGASPEDGEPLPVLAGSQNTYHSPHRELHVLSGSCSSETSAVRPGQGDQRELTFSGLSGFQDLTMFEQLPSITNIPPMNPFEFAFDDVTGDYISGSRTIEEFFEQTELNHGVASSHALYQTPAALHSENSDNTIIQHPLITSLVHEELRKASKKGRGALLQLAMSIASPESIVMVADIAQQRKIQLEVEPLLLSANPTMALKFQSVFKLDRAAAYSQLLRRFHILEIFKQAGGPTTRSSIGQVLTTLQDVQTPPKRSGNPINAAEAEVTANMMKGIYPDIAVTSDEYKTKSNLMSRYRKLGQRLHILESTFGRGILTLLPSRNLAFLRNIGISDTGILEPTDASFRAVIRAINEGHGDVLRGFSNAMESIVDECVFGIRPSGRESVVTRISIDQVMKCSAASKELLQLISADS